MIFGYAPIWFSSSLRSGTNFYNDLTTVMQTDASQSQMGDFYDNYWPSTPMNWLAANVSVSDRLDMVYDAGPDLVRHFVDRVSQPVLEGIINSISGMNVSTYLAYINNSASGVVQYTGPTDTMSLAEHHIYGSSRLGYAAL